MIYEIRIHEVHVTRGWVMSRMNESCHTRMSHVTYQRVTLHMYASCPIWTSHVTCERVMSRVMGHVIHEQVMSDIHESRHARMDHVTYGSCHIRVTSRTNGSCHIRVMSHTSHVTYKAIPHMKNRVCSSKQGWSTADIPHEWVVSHMWMSHVAHITQSCHAYEWVMSHTCVSHITHMNEQQSRTFQTGYARQHRGGLTHIALMNESCHTYLWGMSHIWMSHVTHMNEACRT